MTLIATDNLVNNTINQIKLDYDLDITNLKNIYDLLHNTVKNIHENITSTAKSISHADNDYFQPIIANMIISFINNIIINKQPDIDLSYNQINDFAHLCVTDLNELYTCIGGADDHIEMLSIFRKIAQNKIFSKYEIYHLFVSDNEFISFDDSVSLDQNEPMFDDIYNIVRQNLNKIVPNYLQQSCNNNYTNNNIINEIDSLKNEIARLKAENDFLEEKIRDIIPIEHQCCICFGYTHKQQVCVPCGHTQYCTNCIKRIDKCALCNTHITDIIKVYV